MLRHWLLTVALVYPIHWKLWHGLEERERPTREPFIQATLILAFFSQFYTLKKRLRFFFQNTVLNTTNTTIPHISTPYRLDPLRFGKFLILS